MYPLDICFNFILWHARNYGGLWNYGELWNYEGLWNYGGLWTYDGLWNFGGLLDLLRLSVVMTYFRDRYADIKTYRQTYTQAYNRNTD